MSKRKFSEHPDPEPDENQNIDNQEHAEIQEVRPNPKKVKDFFRVEGGGGGGKETKGEPKGVCLLCGKKKVCKIVKMKGSNTTGLKRHMERYHLHALSTVSEQTTMPKPTQKTIAHMFSDNQKNTAINCIENDIQKEIVRFVAKKCLPLNFFDDEESQHFFRILNSNVKMPLRNSLRARVFEAFEKTRLLIGDLLKNNSSKISCTIDGWTSISGKSYYGITAHYINDTWELKSLTLDFVPSNGNHTGKDISNLFFQSLKEFGILHKIQGITMDNAASNTTFINTFICQMNLENFNLEAETLHYRCFAHILNLAVQDAIKLLCVIDDNLENAYESDEETEEETLEDREDDQTTVSKIRTLFIKLRRSEQLRNKLLSCCTVTNTKYLSPAIDVSTRWNSTFVMIKTALLMKPAIIALCSNDILLSNYALIDEEWYLLEHICNFLKHFKYVSTLLGGEKYVTLPLVIVAFNMLLDKIEAACHKLDAKVPRTEVDENLILAYQAARDKLIKYYLKTNWIYCVLLILDPRHKTETFQLSEWGREIENRTLMKFKNIYKNVYYQSFEKNSLSGTTENVADSSDGIEIEIDLKALFESGNKIGEDWNFEINNYLNSKRSHKDEDILSWWAINRNTYPCLAAMARDFLAIPATSVPAERLFSKAGIIIRKHRNRLSNDSARALLCLNSWTANNIF